LQIAADLRLAAGKRGENEVKLRLKLLTFMRQLMTIPAEPLKLRFFDECGVKLQHLKDLYARYEPLFEKDPAEARRLLENWLLSVQVGLTAVHKLRAVDQYFDTEYMLPQLRGDEGLGHLADVLADTGPTDGPAPSKGVNALLAGSGDASPSPSVAGNLLNLLIRSDKRIEVSKPGVKHPVQLEQQDVLDAVKAATFDGVKAKEGDDREDNKMEAPAKSLKDATASLEKTVVALGRVHNDPEFDRARRSTLVAALKKHRRTLKNIEARFVELGVPIE
jgi:hypothetical protein